MQKQAGFLFARKCAVFQRICRMQKGLEASRPFFIHPSAFFICLSRPGTACLIRQNSFGCSEIKSSTRVATHGKEISEGGPQGALTNPDVIA